MGEPGQSDPAAGNPFHEHSDDVTHILWRDRDAEVIDFARAERRTLSLATRLSGCVEPIEIRTQTSLIRGHVLALCSDFIVLGDARNQQMRAVVANIAVLGIEGIPVRTTAHPDSLVHEQTRIAAWLARIEGSHVRVIMSGVVMHGHLLYMWGDHFDLNVNENRIAVPLVAVHSLHVIDHA